VFKALGKVAATSGIGAFKILHGWYQLQKVSKTLTSHTELKAKTPQHHATNACARCQRPSWSLNVFFFNVPWV